jgi:hypothetical protein
MTIFLCSHCLSGVVNTETSNDCLRCGQSASSVPVTQPVYAVRDRWHIYKNGDNQPEVRSDDPCFLGDISNFIGWINQHGGTVAEMYSVKI